MTTITETRAVHELDVLYDNRALDVALLNDNESILTFADDVPSVPLTDDELFDETIHSWDTPSSLMDPQSRKAASAAFELLAQRYTQVTGNRMLYFTTKLESASLMLHSVYAEWRNRYLDTNANMADLKKYVDWVENVMWFHEPYAFSGAPSRLSNIYTAHSNLMIDVNRVKQQYRTRHLEFELPQIVIAAPGVAVSASEGSGCFVARWDDIGTDIPLKVPVSDSVVRELRKRGVLPKLPPVLPGLEQLILGGHRDLRTAQKI